MRIYFETLGCPKNFNDSQIAKGILETKGYEIAESPEDYLSSNGDPSPGK